MYRDSEYVHKPGLFLNKKMLFCSWIKDRTLGQNTCWIKWPWKSCLGTDSAFSGVNICSSIEEPLTNTFPLLFELGGANSWLLWCYKTLIVLTKNPFYLETFVQKYCFPWNVHFCQKYHPVLLGFFFYFLDYISDGTEQCFKQKLSEA